MSVEVTCGKCGGKVATMRMLRPLRDVTGQHQGRCPSCGQRLSSTEFSLDAVEN